MILKVCLGFQALKLCQSSLARPISGWRYHLTSIEHLSAYFGQEPTYTHQRITLLLAKST